MSSTYDERLAALRATDSLGHYAHDAPVTGRDETGSLFVTIDPTRRVVGVSAGQLPEPLRSAEGLDHAVRRAHTDAVMDGIEAALRARGQVDPQAPRRTVARRAVRGPRVAERFPDFGHEGADLAFYRSLEGMRRGGPREADAGISDNECVVVTLDLSGPAGRVEADPGWLRQAGPAQVAAAVLQAFTAAYEKRDAHG